MRSAGAERRDRRVRSASAVRREHSRAIVGIGLAVAVLVLATAASAGAHVWVVSSATKVFPSSRPTSVRSLSIGAARNEYEAAQLAVSGTVRRRVTVSWDPSSDPLLVGSTELFTVGYVTITRPSTGVGSRRGRYPDPLLPAAFGAPAALSKGANAFYVRVHVPADASPGLYSGTLVVDDPGNPRSGGYPAAPVRVPVRLTVYDFGWSRTSLSTAFPMSIKVAMLSVAGALRNTAANRAALSDQYYRFWAQHDISPARLWPMPPVNRTTGEMDGSAVTAAFSPYLSDSDVSPGLFVDTTYPLLQSWPWPAFDPGQGASPARHLPGELFRLYVANGWQDKGYFYVYDEPNYREELQSAELASSPTRCRRRSAFEPACCSPTGPARKPSPGSGRTPSCSIRSISGVPASTATSTACPSSSGAARPARRPGGTRMRPSTRRATRRS